MKLLAAAAVAAVASACAVQIAGDTDGSFNLKAALGLFGLYGAPSLFVLALLLQVYTQCVRRPGEPRLFAGCIPFLGLAVPFGKDHAKLLRECAAQCGEHERAFTLYIAGKRMTFIKNPLDFSRVLRERKRLVFGPVSEEIMKSCFNAPDFDRPGVVKFRTTDEHQWQLLRGEPLSKLMNQTQVGRQAGRQAGKRVASQALPYIPARPARGR